MRTDSTAERTDRSTGAREIAEFVDVDGDRVYAVQHLPPENLSPNAGLVICSPFFAEFPRNYRREVLLARRLAGLGVAAARFHYRGVGNSTGDPALLRLERLVEDIHAVTERLVERSGAVSVGYHATRLAALAAGAAASGDKAPLSLWDPVVSGEKYFNEVLRTRMAQALHDQELGVSAGALRSQLAEGEAVDVLGHSLHSGFYDSMIGVELPEVIGAAPREVLIVEFGRGRKAVDRWIERLVEHGSHPVRVPTSEGESWWVANRRADYFVAEERRPLTHEVLEAAVAWIEQLGWQR